MSTTTGAGFSTVNLIVGQWTTGVEWESTLYVTRSFRLHAALGWLNVKAERQGGVRPVAPLTPELTLSLSPAYGWWPDNGAEIATRTGAECGEPSSDPGRLTRIGGRSQVNFHLGYDTPGGAWTAAV